MTSEWYGTLTIDNAEKLFDMLKSLLEENTFTFVTSYHHNDHRPIVHTGMQIEGNIARGSDSAHAWINIALTGSVWHCSTNTQDNEEDTSYTNPYFEFEEGQVTIIHRTNDEEIYFLVFAVEGLEE